MRLLSKRELNEDIHNSNTDVIIISTFLRVLYSSVCKQDFKDYEIVVVDDSTDSSTRGLRVFA